MKVAVVGSRHLYCSNLSEYLPIETTEIVSGGAMGIDFCAKSYALEQRLQYTEFTPEYRRFGRGAPLKRNIEIVTYADFVLIFWDGQSRGTKFVIKECQKQGVPYQVVRQTVD